MATREKIIADAVATLDDMPALNDEEISHGIADDVLLNALTELGAGEITEAWKRAKERIGFWYA